MAKKKVKKSSASKLRTKRGTGSRKGTTPASKKTRRSRGGRGR